MSHTDTDTQTHTHTNTRTCTHKRTLTQDISTGRFNHNDNHSLNPLVPLDFVKY